ncbi:MAG: flagellin [Gemmatimonadetes bacterium]|nr:flagellin [Gemmatimonadota bacterium]
MPLRVNNNIAAINSRRRLNANNRDLTLRLERLSSGLRINRAADDAAGLSVREGMRAEISGLKMNVKNAEQATNLLQVGEGSLNEINAMLIRMRELAVQSANSTLNDQNRESVQAEYTQIIEEIDRIAKSTTYNDQVLLTGFGNAVSVSAQTSASDGYLGNSTAKAGYATGVTNIKLSGAQAGTYEFDDEPTADTNGQRHITLSNGTVSQTISIGTLLDGNVVATGTKIVANFDRLGIQVTLAGEQIIEQEDGTAITDSGYKDGDLDTKKILIEEGTGGSFQVGPDDGVDNRIETTLEDMTASGAFLNVDESSVSTINDAREAITKLDLAITKVSGQRGNLGAWMNRLAFTISFTENEIENIQASEASISDADMASEISSFTRAQILSQAATAMLAQANILPQNALSLLQ